MSLYIRRHDDIFSLQFVNGLMENPPFNTFYLYSCVHSAGQTPRKVRQHYTGELMDVYCSQCSKKVNLLNDLEARLKNLKANR